MRQIPSQLYIMGWSSGTVGGTLDAKTFSGSCIGEKLTRRPLYMTVVPQAHLSSSEKRTKYNVQALTKRSMAAPTQNNAEIGDGDLVNRTNKPEELNLLLIDSIKITLL